MAEKATGFEIIEEVSTFVDAFSIDSSLPSPLHYLKSMNPFDEFERTATLENSCNSQTLRALRHSSLLRM